MRRVVIFLSEALRDVAFEHMARIQMSILFKAISTALAILNPENWLVPFVIFSSYYLIFNCLIEPDNWGNLVSEILNHLNKVGLGITTLVFIIGFSVSIISYYATFGAYMLLESFASKEFLYNHKIQKPRSEKSDKSKIQKNIDSNMMKHIIRRVSINNFIVMPLISYVYIILFSKFHSLEECLLAPPPPCITAINHFLFFLAVESTLFYYLHRLFHTSFLYKKIHKIHHELKSPIPISAIYAHPLEHVIVNVMPIMLGPFIFGSHVAISALWFMVVNFNTVVSHSGYKIYCLDGTDHDNHHKYFYCNFGIYLFDWLHGTTEKDFRSNRLTEKPIY